MRWFGAFLPCLVSALLVYAEYVGAAEMYRMLVTIFPFILGVSLGHWLRGLDG
jgi:hypothetical protein